jgi:hypothetical protein
MATDRGQVQIDGGVGIAAIEVIVIEAAHLDAALGRVSPTAAGRRG